MAIDAFVKKKKGVLKLELEFEPLSFLLLAPHLLESNYFCDQNMTSKRERKRKKNRECNLERKEFFH